MTITLLTDQIWRTLTKAAKGARGPSAVAVAYFGQAGARMLPLKSGSRLVVDASEGAVKSGQTCPAELRKLYNRGVRVYSVQNLHAKVFVFGTKTFMGSVNVSRRSADTLVEAMLATTDRNVVTAARAFVRSWCRQELGPEEIDRLGKLYRPPRIAGVRQARNAGAKRREGADLPRVLLAQVRPEANPLGSANVYEAGRRVAAERQKDPKRHELSWFWQFGKSRYRRNDMVVQVVEESRNRYMVEPPGRVLNTRAGRRKGRTTTFVYLEVPIRRRVALKRLARRIGRGAGKQLSRDGVVSHDFAARLLEAWST